VIELSVTPFTEISGTKYGSERKRMSAQKADFALQKDLHINEISGSHGD
jgi:hypothetical protein